MKRLNVKALITCPFWIWMDMPSVKVTSHQKITGFADVGKYDGKENKTILRYKVFLFVCTPSETQRLLPDSTAAQIPVSLKC